MTHVRIRIDGRLHEVTLTKTEEGQVAVVDGVEVTIASVVEDTPAPRTVTVDSGDGPLRVGRLSLTELEADGIVSTYRIEEVIAAGATGVVGSEGAAVRPPMPGKVVKLRVSEGEAVEQGQVLFVLEAMKMQNEVVSPATGTVRALKAPEGATVDTGDVVVVLGPPEKETTSTPQEVTA
ncbi:MAG: biotin/lipoyl-binding protein [Euryarchaeota archaeon]|nr:biotin/lipoyl-binding protein [Euryarchaeota archaeon]